MERASNWSRITVALAVALLLAIGCDKGKSDAQKDVKKDVKKDGQAKEPDSHADLAPHKGKLFADEGDKHHVELLPVDKAAKKVTVYLYDGKLKNPVPISEKTINMNIADGTPVQIELKAEPQETDPAGNASRFTAVNDRLAKDLDLAKVEFEVKINGQSRVFKLDED